MKQSEHKNISSVIKTNVIKTYVIKTIVIISLIVPLCMILYTVCQDAGNNEDAADSVLQ